MHKPDTVDCDFLTEEFIFMNSYIRYNFTDGNYLKYIFCQMHYKGNNSNTIGHAHSSIYFFANHTTK